MNLKNEGTESGGKSFMVEVMAERLPKNFLNFDRQGNMRNFPRFKKKYWEKWQLKTPFWSLNFRKNNVA